MVLKRDYVLWIVVGASLVWFFIVIYHGSRTTIAKTPIQFQLDSWKSSSHRDGFPSYPQGSDTGRFPLGILSKQPRTFFAQIQNEIDEEDNALRCERYGFAYDPSAPQRRMFLGSLIADEPWEVLELVAAEVYGLLEGIVFVESNRTQDTTIRGFHRLQHKARLNELYGVKRLQVRTFVNEDTSVNGLNREHAQREEILRGWIEMGMGQEDIGILADSDETFSRDFLRAAQACDVPAFRHEIHQCRHSIMKIRGDTQVFETSPECPRRETDRPWVHPDMIVGACLEGIADEDQHPPAPRQRNSFLRFPGFGKKCDDFDLYYFITDGRYPSWNAADFRRCCGGYSISLNTNQFPAYSRFTAFHFHNFFSSLNATRQKHFTYGHPNKKAFQQGVRELGEDYKMMHSCIKGVPESDDQKYHHAPGGFADLKPNVPIYFQDSNYRLRRHTHVVSMVKHDELLYG